MKKMYEIILTKGHNINLDHNLLNHKILPLNRYVIKPYTVKYALKYGKR